MSLDAQGPASRGVSAVADTGGVAKKTVFHRWLYAPARFRLLVGLYPPLLGAGVRVAHIAEDWTDGSIAMRVYPWTSNLHGAAFGGALFSATDVLYGMMLSAQLGRDYEVWTKAASIDFHRPGRGTLRLRVQLSPEEADRIRGQAARDGAAEVIHQVEIVDGSAAVVASAQHTMRVRSRSAN